jgi:hypothetical protein
MLLMAVLGSWAHGQSAERIMEGARLAATLQNVDLRGEVIGRGQRIPIALFLKEKNIQFQFYQDGRWTPFHLRLGDDQFDLFEFKNRKSVPFPAKKLEESIAGSDVTYEDLSFRFLYWPQPKLLGDERVRTHDCWKIRVPNPGFKGAYRLVYVWVHKDSGAFMKIEGFDQAGTRLKRFEVQSVMKLADGSYTLKEMRVSTMRGDRALSHSTLKFEKPKRNLPGRR